MSLLFLDLIFYAINNSRIFVRRSSTVIKCFRGKVYGLDISKGEVTHATKRAEARGEFANLWNNCTRNRSYW